MRGDIQRATAMFALVAKSYKEISLLVLEATRRSDQRTQSSTSRASRTATPARSNPSAAPSQDRGGRSERPPARTGRTPRNLAASPPADADLQNRARQGAASGRRPNGWRRLGRLAFRSPIRPLAIGCGEEVRAHPGGFTVGECDAALRAWTGRYAYQSAIIAAPGAGEARWGGWRGGHRRLSGSMRSNGSSGWRGGQ